MCESQSLNDTHFPLKEQIYGTVAKINVQKYQYIKKKRMHFHENKYTCVN